MIIRVAPGIRDRFKAIGLAILVRVADPSQLAALRDVERIVFPRETEDLIQPRSKQMIRRIGFRIVKAVHQIDFTMTSSHGHSFVWQHCESAGLDHRVRRQRDVDDRIVLAFAFFCAPSIADLFGIRCAEASHCD